MKQFDLRHAINGVQKMQQNKRIEPRL